MAKSILKRTSLKEQISEIILERIFSGELKPGDRIKELVIARELGTSQAPVREALRTLESKGYLEHKTHSGTVVISLNEKDINELNQIREAIEQYALTEGFTTLQEKIYLLDEIITDLTVSKGKDEIMMKDNKFHQVIFEAFENDRMFEIWTTMSNRLRIVFNKLQIDTDYKDIIPTNTSILESIKKGNARQAIRYLQEYYLLWQPNDKNIDNQ